MTICFFWHKGQERQLESAILCHFIFSILIGGLVKVLWLLHMDSKVIKKFIFDKQMIFFHNWINQAVG